MSSNMQSQETITPSPVRDQSKKLNMIESFVKELVVDRDFKVNDSGDIVMIRHLPVSKCTVPLLRQICVRFKVSGYKNQNKESTLGLLKNLVMRETLKNNMYKEDDDSDSYFSVSSKEGNDPTPTTAPRQRNLSKSNAENKDVEHHEDVEYQVGEEVRLPPLDEDDDDHGSDEDAGDHDGEMKTTIERDWPRSRNGGRRNRKAPHLML
ncbi:hypothetical protein MHU86_13842 [Fragilaria crotonensis]|nr:hypothetical protein MHU86_13842 [Fragilaria crotonensis]